VRHHQRDKVRLKLASHKGKRAIIERLQGQTLVVRVTETGECISVKPTELTNFSLAARMAWKSMPDRRVGRPKGTRTVDRKSVTLRVDRVLWQGFQEAEAKGMIVDRTATINAWIQKGLESLHGH
jgi:hypothetical protein